MREASKETSLADLGYGGLIALFSRLLYRFERLHNMTFKSQNPETRKNSLRKNIHTVYLKGPAFPKGPHLFMHVNMN